MPVYKTVLSYFFFSVQKSLTNVAEWFFLQFKRTHPWKAKLREGGKGGWEGRLREKRDVCVCVCLCVWVSAWERGRERESERRFQSYRASLWAPGGTRQFLEQPLQTIWTWFTGLLSADRRVSGLEPLTVFSSVLLAPSSCCEGSGGTSPVASEQRGRRSMCWREAGERCGADRGCPELPSLYLPGCLGQDFAHSA